MTVGDVISACEYIGCVILDALGNEIDEKKEEYADIRERGVEHISAYDSTVQIWTFVNMDKLVEQCTNENKEEDV